MNQPAAAALPQSPVKITLKKSDPKPSQQVATNGSAATTAANSSVVDAAEDDEEDETAMAVDAHAVAAATAESTDESAKVRLRVNRVQVSKLFERAVPNPGNLSSRNLGPTAHLIA